MCIKYRQIIWLDVKTRCRSFFEDYDHLPQFSPFHFLNSLLWKYFLATSSGAASSWEVFMDQQKQPPEVFYEKSVLRNFAKFTGNTCAVVSFFNKVAGMRPATLLKKRLRHRCFPVNFAKFLRTSFLKNTSGRLLLDQISVTTCHCVSWETKLVKHCPKGMNEKSETFS